MRPAIARVALSLGAALLCASTSASEEAKAEGFTPLAVEDYDVPPKPVEVTRPVYPPKAFEEGVEGTVMLEILIDAQGRVKKAKVTQSVPGLDKAALECVRTWRFKPAEKAGRPVATIAKAPVVFRRYWPGGTKS